MFIFANTFEMLNMKVITKKSVDNYELYPILQVLEYTAGHLGKRIFDTEKASIDDNIKIVILRT
jgi:hypothetical protein